MIDIHIVLVRTQFPMNIGSVSRAMANMGAQNLILIDKKCAVDAEAHQAAAGAQNHLLNRREYSSWQEFFEKEPDGIRLAFSRRSGRNRSLESFEALIEKQRRSAEGPWEQMFLVFGPEDHGLVTEDLTYCNQLCELPIYGEYGSLNLSHAVMLALYILRSRVESNVLSTKEAKSFQFPESLLQDWIDAIGFDHKKRGSSALNTLRRIVLKAQPKPEELYILESVFNQCIRRLNSGGPTTEK